MFVVENMDRYANLPTLRFDGNASIFGHLRNKTNALEYRTVRSEGQNSIILADNLPDLVSFYAVSGADKNGYGGAAFQVMLDGQPVTLVGPWSSRAGCFNTDDEKIAVVECAVQSCLYHFKLSFLLDLIRKTNANIGFFKVQQFSENEIYYVPCVFEAGRFTKTLMKLKGKNSGVNKVEGFILPNSTMIPASIPLPAKM